MWLQIYTNALYYDTNKFLPIVLSRVSVDYIRRVLD
jgi:hypothetical protein